MKIRIKVTGSGLDMRYNVQTRTGLFWKTRFRCKEFGSATQFADELKHCNEYNKPKQQKKEFVVWGVRQRHKCIQDLSSFISLYSDYPQFETNPNSSASGLWRGNNFGELKVNNLFGKNTLEPTQYKITIEEIS